MTEKKPTAGEVSLLDGILQGTPAQQRRAMAKAITLLESTRADHRAQEAFDRCKAQVKSHGLAGPGKVRVNKAGCLDRCAGGPVAVVYPDAVWYTYVDQSDIDEIVTSHLRDGVPVERLRLAPDVGR